MPSITDAVQSATNAVAATTSAALTGINGGMSAAQAALAPNAWVGAADNKLATADVYSPPGKPSVITDIQNLFQQFNFAISDVLRGGKYIAANIAAAERGVKMLTSGDVLSRVLGASVLTKAALNSLGAVGLGNIADTINSGINMAEGAVGSAIGQVSNQVYAEIGGVVSAVSAATAEGLGAVGACINSLGVNASFSINDVGAKVSIFSGLIQTASGYGMPNSYGSLIASISDRGMIGQITMKVLPSIVSNSDVHSLLSIGATLGARGAYAYNPNIIADFSSSYTTPLPTSTGSQTDYTQAFSDITNAYSSVDPDWATLNRETTITDENGNDLTQNDPAFNLNAITNGSDDFQKVVTQGVTSTTDRTNNVMALAGVVQQSTVAAKLADQFPLTVFNGNNQTASTQNPLAIAAGVPQITVPTGYSDVAPNTGATPSSSTTTNYDIADAKLENGIYVWPDGHFQVGGTHTATATSQGYTSKGITFD
jgi:hypothetical protein